ncbi:MAG: hypothetical protein E6972_23575, partial [Serratia marcescens]|nr:hypothetical protein [Serratia marcescens]
IMNQLVKIYRNDDGDDIPKSEQYWHLSMPSCGEPSVFCSGEYYTFGGSCNVIAEQREKEKGGITCPLCLELIRKIKAVKL